jgi:hypothetical protein
MSWIKFFFILFDQKQFLRELEQGSTQERVVQQAIRAPQPAVEVDYLVEIKGGGVLNALGSIC